MKDYFEYPFDEKIKNKLISYYENINLDQHKEKQERKTKIKLYRIEKLINFNKRDLVLDIGCSSGFFLKKISKKIKLGFGIDISKNIIKNNRKLLLEKLKFENFDGENINLNKKFDKIFLIDVLEHSFYPNKLINSVYDNLKESGMVIIEVPFSGFLSELIYGKYHQGHLRYYNNDYLKKFLEKNNFKVVEINNYNSVPFASFLLKYQLLWKIMDKFCNLIPSKYYPYFGEIIVLAKKK